MRGTTFPHILGGIAVSALFLAGCRGSPADLTLPPPRSHGVAAKDVPAKPVYEAAEYHGVNGGRIRFTVPGSRRQATEMLLDFDGANKRRKWADKYKTLTRTPSRVTARFEFAGKMGVNPTVELAFDVDRKAGATTIRYHLTKTAFGLARFFGDYQVLGVSGRSDVSVVEERVYISSGLPFVDASKDDIKKGLFEDAKALKKWMAERRSRKGPAPSQ